MGEVVDMQSRTDKLRKLFSKKVSEEFAAELPAAQLRRLVDARLDNAENLSSLDAKEDLTKAPVSLPLGTAARLFKTFTGGGPEVNPGTSAGNEIDVAFPGMQKFWNGLSNVELEVDGTHCFATLPPDGGYWFGNEALGKTIYVRASYKALWELIQVEVNLGPPGVALLGNPGIGKSIMGCYMMMMLKTLGNTVVYHARDGFVYLFNGDDPVMASSPTVGEWAFRTQLHDPATWYICDSIAPLAFGAKTVLITSPTPAVHKSFVKRVASELFMDRWEVAEMVALRHKSYPGLCTEDGLALFDQLMSRYGPIPRLVLEQTTSTTGGADNFLGKLDRALQQSDPMAWLQAVNQKDADDSKMSHMVVHMRTNDFKSSYYSMASDWVTQQVVERAMQEGSRQFFQMMNGMSNISGFEAVFGELYQSYVFHFLKKVGGIFDCRTIGKRKGGVGQIALKPGGADEFDRLTNSTFKHFNTLYFQRFGSSGPKLAGLDAIITPVTEGVPARFIQITVGHKKQALSEDGLRDAVDALQSFCPGATYEVLYLVPAKSYSKFQAAPVYKPQTQTAIERKVVKFPEVSPEEWAAAEMEAAVAVVPPGDGEVEDADMLEE